MDKDLLDEITDIEVLRVGYRQLNKLVMIKENKLDQQQQEIERLKEQLNDEIDDELKQSEIMVKQHNEIERLHSIIKEVREYIKENKVDLSWFMTTDKSLKIEGISNVVSTFRLLEILDKVGDEK